jgi:hypothetical protein
MISGNYDNHAFNDSRTRKSIFGVMWVLSALMTGGLIYGIYALRG